MIHFLPTEDVVKAVFPTWEVIAVLLLVLALVGIGIWWIRYLRKKRVSVLLVSKSLGNRRITFSSKKALNTWYNTNTDWEGIDKVEVIR